MCYSLKKESEARRRQMEDDSRLRVEDRDPITGETIAESIQRQEQQQHILQLSIMEEQKAKQHIREAKRYTMLFT